MARPRESGKLRIVSSHEARQTDQDHRNPGVPARPARCQTRLDPACRGNSYGWAMIDSGEKNTIIDTMNKCSGIMFAYLYLLSQSAKNPMPQFYAMRVHNLLSALDIGTEPLKMRHNATSIRAGKRREFVSGSTEPCVGDGNGIAQGNSSAHRGCGKGQVNAGEPGSRNGGRCPLCANDWPPG